MLKISSCLICVCKEAVSTKAGKYQFVIPVQTGIHSNFPKMNFLFRGNDRKIFNKNYYISKEKQQEFQELFNCF